MSENYSVEARYAALGVSSKGIIEKAMWAVRHPEEFARQEAERKAEFARKYGIKPEERLAYYRAHGLVCCDDYPGGDKQFEQDVLSRRSDYRLDGGVDRALTQEEAYIIEKMGDGSFTVDRSYEDHISVPQVLVVFYDTQISMGQGAPECYYWAVRHYPGGIDAYRADMMSGEFYMRLNAWRRKDWEERKTRRERAGNTLS